MALPLISTRDGHTREITLDDVLYNRTKDPFTMRVLFDYLDTVAATELLDFWVAALDVKNMFEPESARSSYSMHKWAVDSGAMELGSTDMSAELDKAESEAKAEAAQTKKEELARRYADAQRLMVATYIDEEAPLCINVSDATRRRVIKSVPKEGEPPHPGLFDECMAECERLIRTNHFHAFCAKAEEARRQRKADLQAKPPPKPRHSQVIKGKLRTREEIQAHVPVGEPPASPAQQVKIVVGQLASTPPPPPPRPSEPKA